MNRLLPPLAMIASLVVSGLGGCTTTAVATRSTVSTDAARAFVAAESGFDAAVVTADVAIRSGRLAPATTARIRTLADDGHACIVAGRAALEAVDAAGVTSQTAAILALVAQLATLSKG